jgi:hypothetical protein
MSSDLRIGLFKKKNINLIKIIDRMRKMLNSKKKDWQVMQYASGVEIVFQTLLNRMYIILRSNNIYYVNTIKR